MRWSCTSEGVFDYYKPVDLREMPCKNSGWLIITELASSTQMELAIDANSKLRRQLTRACLGAGFPAGIGPVGLSSPYSSKGHPTLSLNPICGPVDLQ